MSIFNQNPDPDYPVLTGPGFIQHTCQAPTYGQPQQFYYNGQSVMPVQPAGYPVQPTFGYDSRRYDMPAQPVMQATPVVQQPQQSFGFNQLAEASRRNMTVPVQPTPATAPSAAPVSPWAAQPMPQPQAVPQYPVTAQVPAAYDPRYSAIYNLHPQFDKKKGVWGNQEMTTPCMPPIVNWGAQPEVPQYGYGYPAQPQPIPVYQYPQQVQQPVVQDWYQIAKANFGK